MDNKRFEKAKEKIIGIDRERHGIGTQSEKTMHAVLKYYMEPDEDHHEIPIDRYIADIYKDGKIIEIQTRQFNRLRGKLNCFLKDYPVKIIYPIPSVKWMVWVNEETGELSKPRKSPKKASYFDAFIELYKIKMYLSNPNISFKLISLEVTEYKLLNGWSEDKKRGSYRDDRIPMEILEERDIDCVKDYMQFVPYELPEEFTVKDFAKAAHISLRLAQTTISILKEVGTISFLRKGPHGIYIYHVNE